MNAPLAFREHNEQPQLDLVRSFSCYPQPLGLERWYWVPPLVFGSAMAANGGMLLLLARCLLAVVVLYHVTFTINALTHMWCRWRFSTREERRTDRLWALWTFGKDRQFNRSDCSPSTFQGFRCWGLDISFYILRARAALGVVWRLWPVPVYSHTARDRRSRFADLTRPLLVLTILLLPAESPAREIFSFTGIARTKNGNIAYREVHRERHAGGKLLEVVTRYFSAGGQPIARLTSDFRKNPDAPNYSFVDYRRPAFCESATINGALLILSAKSRSKRIRVPRAGRLVLGQGLHHFVRRNFDSLEAGRTLRINFAIPSRFDTYRFRVRKVGNPRPGVVRLRVEIDSWILRLLAPHLEVDYMRAGRRLLRYRGVSNIQTLDGDQQKVLIRYRYKTAKPKEG